MEKNVQAMKVIMAGDSEDPSGENQNQLANETYASDLLPNFVAQLSKMDFEV